jgi:hypothetical protein
VNWNVIRRNFREGFVWDNDNLQDNFISHPYHGGLFFNIARSSGLSFWESVPYSAGGSLMWEFFLENHAPSPNDLIVTSAGGVSFGEVTFRLSSLVVDNRATGWSRFGRELLVALISPMQGLSRILSGEAWKTQRVKGRFAENIPVRFNITGGYQSGNNACVDFRLSYGGDEVEKPYDAFQLELTVNPLTLDINKVTFTGQLWKAPARDHSLAGWGFFQHFHYYDSDAFFKDKTVSYKFSEAASFGVGGQIRANVEEATLTVTSYLNAVLLGCHTTDYYRVVRRDYNYGSGFSAKAGIGLVFGEEAQLTAGMEDYRLFTWKGYGAEVDLTHIATHEEAAAFNAQGDVGNTRLAVLNLAFIYCFRKHYTFSAGVSCYWRESHYRFFPDKRDRFMESKLGLGYTF